MVRVEVPKIGWKRGEARDCGEYWEINGCNTWPSSDGRDVPYNILRCKKCGFEVIMQIAGSFVSGGPAEWELDATTQMRNHLSNCPGREKEKVYVFANGAALTGAKKPFVPR